MRLPHLRLMLRELRPFNVLVAVLVIASIALDLINNRFWTSDLRVYHDAAHALAHHGQVYGVPFGEDTGFFKYAPVVAMAFVPCTWLPFKLAAVLHLLIEGLALIWTVSTIERILMRHVHGRFVRPVLGRALLLLLCTAVLLVREFHLGNINLLLLLLAVRGSAHTADRDHAWAGTCFGLLWLAKPYLAFIAVPLLMHGRWRIALNGCLMVLLGLVLPFVLLGPTRAWELHRQWLLAMGAHGSYLTSPDTVMALLERHFNLHLEGVWPELGIIGLAGASMALLSLSGNASARFAPFPARNTLLDIWIALAIVPLLVVTDEEHFLFATPLIACCIAALFTKRHGALLALFILAMALFATRSSDLLGSEFYARTAAAGALGMGNLLLLCTAVGLRFRA